MSERHYSTDGPVCPFCDWQHHPEEAFYYDESLTEMTCDVCDLDFPVRVYTSTSWTTAQSIEDL